MRYFLINGLCTVLLVSACSVVQDGVGTINQPPIVTEAEPAQRLAPKDARTAEQFDTTTVEERSAAEVALPTRNPLIGTTVASLGDPTAGGFWLETPLVDTVQTGSITAKATGKSVALELRPIAGADTAGSRISLAAMRLLEVGLTDLPELDVYKGG
ncbi:MAG: hypothetical protein ABJO67_03055 [Pseudoruegeria sp.]